MQTFDVRALIYEQPCASEMKMNGRTNCEPVITGWNFPAFPFSPPFALSFEIFDYKRK